MENEKNDFDQPIKKINKYGYLSKTTRKNQRQTYS